MKRTAIILLLFNTLAATAQPVVMDAFESTEGWDFIRSDGVTLELTAEPGHTGKAARFGYEFTTGTGYGGMQKLFPVDLPENFEFTFYLRADSPANNFEIKFIDSTGNNVWWVNNRNYDFPRDWTKIRVKKRHIEFAWGPAEDRSLKRIDRIEFTIASYVGGKGTVWIDDLRFEPLPPETGDYPPPVLSATSSLKGHPESMMTDGKDGTFWQSKGPKDQQIEVDFTVRREFGGLHILWQEDLAPGRIDIMASDDATTWEKIYSVTGFRGEESFIRLPEAQARYLRIFLSDSRGSEGFGIRGIRFLDIGQSMTPNDFFIYAATRSPVGDYPRYFLEQASYWTVTGVNYDVKEALVNEDGMVEVEKGKFSIEPMVRVGDSLFNWNNVRSSQSLGFDAGEDFRFLPTVTWEFGPLDLVIEVSSGGEANARSVLNIDYTLHNRSGMAVDADLYLLVRPFQVNPYYQWLNLTGGAGKIHSIRGGGQEVLVDDKRILSLQKMDRFGAGSADQGDPAGLLRRGELPEAGFAEDPHAFAHGVMAYAMKLDPDEERQINVMVPYYESTLSCDALFSAHAQDREFWQDMTSHIQFNLPPSADPIIDTWKANLAYILINRDNSGIQPGSRSYERSWIRDGSLTSSALLKSGIVEEVKDFIEWYAPYQFDNGKVPCVVDFRGPDPVPEHDSHGELIYLIREYFNFTNDTAFLRSMNGHVLRAVDYIAAITAERSTDHFRNGNDSIRAYYGLVPESISHEGYSAKPMHSYWDNFFTMKGLKDAAEIQRILGEEGHQLRIAALRDTFRVNLYNSIDLAMKVRGIDYIPGCVELGDFDATSTTIALTPCNELNNLPRPEVYNTFDKYYEYFRDRRDGRREWVNYTPYENRLIGSFILLDQPDRAHELIDFFLGDRRPQGWHHWAEVVWNDDRRPGFIGDMPHTWVGSDFINAVRSMFVYENEYDRTLVLGAGLRQDWIDTPGGMSVEDMPTYYGEVSYAIVKKEDHYAFSIYGDLTPPAGGIRIRNFNGSRLPRRVMINGEESRAFSEKEIRVTQFPAELEIHY